jgi:hypothetical protein
MLLLLINGSCQANMGGQILKKYQSKSILFLLCIKSTSHVAIRMYTLTGNEEYLNPIVNYLYLMGERYQYLYSNLQNYLLIVIENKRRLSMADGYSEKTKRRIEGSLKFPKIAYYLQQLILTNKIYFYHVQDTPFLKSKKNDFKQFILDQENIQIYGAQLVLSQKVHLGQVQNLL